MSWRTIIIQDCAKLEYKLDYLVVRNIDGQMRIHLSEIAVLIIESTAVSLSCVLLEALNKFKIKVIFCDEKHNPSSELIPYYGSHDCSLKLRLQCAWAEEIKKMVWSEIISNKIYNQMRLLKRLGHFNEAELLQKYIEEMELGDESNREGHAAKVYFNALFGKGFSRDDEDNPINAGLNYGYGIILSCFNREICANGYSTQLGIFHSNMFNPFNLASDLMEPYRPLVDYKLIMLNIKSFGTSEKHSMCALLNEELEISGQRCTLLNTIKIYAKSVLDALYEKDISNIRFYRNEL